MDIESIENPILKELITAYLTSHFEINDERKTNLKTY